MRTVVIDSSTTKSIAASSSGTHTFTRAENVPPRFSALHLMLSSSGTTKSISSVITGLVIKSGDELFRLGSFAALSAWCSRSSKEPIPDTASLRVPLDFPDSRLKGTAEVKAVTEVQIVYSTGSGDAQTLALAFEQVFPVPPVEVRLLQVNQNLASGSNSRIQLPRFDGRLKSLLFDDFSKYQRIRVKNAELGIVCDTDANAIRAASRVDNYYNGNAVGLDFDRNGDTDGLLSREQLEIIAQLSAASEDPVYFEVFR